MQQKPFVWISIAVALSVIGIAFLLYRSDVGDNNQRADANDQKAVALGDKLYRQQCATCHGTKLEGQPNWRARLPNGRLPAPPHDASGHTWHHPDRQLFEITKFGTAAYAPPGYQTDMLGFKDVLTDPEIWAVLAYIKSTWPPEIRTRQDATNARPR